MSNHWAGLFSIFFKSQRGDGLLLWRNLGHSKFVSKLMQVEYWRASARKGTIFVTIGIDQFLKKEKRILHTKMKKIIIKKKGLKQGLGQWYKSCVLIHDKSRISMQV